MFDAATLQAIEEIAGKIKVEPAALRAVAQEESGGQAFAMVSGQKRPLIRWEGHYFWARLDDAEREKAKGLASPKAGAVKNPKSQAARWAMVERAAKINRQAALESFSIGVGQVMTAHWKALGYASVDAMIKTARESVAGQIAVMAAYIVKFGLVDELQRRDFTAFARGYNGPGYAKHGYHTRIAKAYAKFSGQPVVSKAAGMLRMGSKGARVRELQGLLVRAGAAVKVDGDYGPTTKKAVMAFQKARKLTVDGVAGPETIRALDVYRVDPDEKIGQQGVTETPEAREGVATIVGGGAVEVVRQQVQDVADKVSWIPGLEWLSTILGALVAVLVLGGIAWGLYGWWKSRRTDEGDVGPVTLDDVEYARDPVLA